MTLSWLVFLPLIQTYTAVYYVLADLLMLSMYFYYKIKNKMNESEFFLIVVFICFTNAP